MRATSYKSSTYVCPVIGALFDVCNGGAMSTSFGPPCIDSTILLPARWVPILVLPRRLIIFVGSTTDLILGAVLGTKFGIPTDSNVEVLDTGIWGVTRFVLALMPMLGSPEDTLLFGLINCNCCSSASLDCSALQTWMPSYHEWPKFAYPALRQFPNQEPPRAQQLSLPDFWMVPHRMHVELTVVVVLAV